jgi:hypothetical protein
MMDLIKRYSTLYFVKILGFCVMGNHFHILVRLFPEHKFRDKEIKKRYVAFYGDDKIFADGWIPSLREKLSNLSEFVREIKVGFTRYRRYVYKAGALDRPDRIMAPVPSSGATGQAKVIDSDIIENERQKNYEISRIDRFMYRTRYFSDSRIIGTKEFVFGKYQRFKDLFMSKREKIPKPIVGLDGIYSLKRLSERRF